MGAPLFFDAGLFEAAHSPRKFLWVCPFRGAFRVPPPHGRGNTENYLCGLDNPIPLKFLTKQSHHVIILVI